VSIPTTGETFAKLIEHIRLAQEDAAMLAHLSRDNHPDQAKMWLMIEDKMKFMGHMIAKIATRRMH